MELLILRDGNTQVSLSPQRGGAMVGYCTRLRDRELHWLLPARGEQLAAFPLVPFCSRIDEGRFTFAGRDVALSPNLPPEPHAIHGHGWQNPWTLEYCDDTQARLSFDYPSGGDWPWAYRAEQRFVLSDGVLKVEMVLINLSHEPMPAGLGMHPYFARTNGVEVLAGVGEMWETDERSMPTRRIPLPDGLEFARGVRLNRQVIDNVFTDWVGNLVVRWPEWDASMSLSASGIFGHLVIYVPRGEDFFCLEPVSNVTDAFNMLSRRTAGHGVFVLEPDEQLDGHVTFKPDYR
tara:strand:+ start:1595 stop:2467 length:873 start_codon:yes stop_codon:yes gene_type:complete